MFEVFYAYTEEYKHNECFLKTKQTFAICTKYNFVRLQNVCDLYIETCMLWNELLLFDVFKNHSPKIHSSIFRKITIDLLSFWGVYDVNLWEKNSGRNLAYKTEAVFPILKQKQSFRGISQKRLFCNVAFLRFSKPGEMPVTEFILVLYLSVLLACYFTKGWTFCQTI